MVGFFQISFSFDHTNQAIDIIIPCMIGMDGSEHEDEKIIDLSGYGSKTRPLYGIKQKHDVELIRKRLLEKSSPFFSLSRFLLVVFVSKRIALLEIHSSF